MNPYEVSYLPPESRTQQSYVTKQVVALSIASVLPLLSTIAERRVSALAALSVFVVGIFVIMTCLWMSAPKRIKPYELLLEVIVFLAVPWIFIAVAMMEIRSNYGYITNVGRYLDLNLDWLYCLFGFSFCQFIFISLGLQLTRVFLRLIRR